MHYIRYFIRRLTFSIRNSNQKQVRGKSGVFFGKFNQNKRIPLDKNYHQLTNPDTKMPYIKKRRKKRNSNRKTAIIVGVLFLAGYVGIFVGDAISGPFLKAPDYLSVIFPNKTRVIIGMLVEVLLNDVPVVGIGVMLFPILRKHNEGIALWYAGIRIVESVTLIVGTISALSLITVSQDYIAAGAADALYYQASGALALAVRHWAADVMLAVFFIIGALILYSILFKSKLVPRFISIWGLISTASLIAANVIHVPDLTKGFHPGQILYFPIMLSEVLLAIWLIVKGFNPSVIASGSAKTDIN